MMALLVHLCLILASATIIRGYFASTWGYRRAFNTRGLQVQQSDDEKSNIDQTFEPQYNVDVFGDIDSADEELLQKMRKARQYINDGWQSRLFRDNLAGSWKGGFEVLLPTFNNAGKATLSKAQAGTVQSKITSAKSSSNNEGCDLICEETISVSFQNPAFGETHPSHATIGRFLFNPTRPAYIPSDFQREMGNQFVGNCFTLAQRHERHLLAEIGIREGPILTRIKFLYQQGPTEALQAQERSQYDMGLLAFIILRESLEDNGSGFIPTLPDFHMNEIGKGIYDPQFSGEPYVEVPLPGKLTLLFPRGLKNNNKASLAMEWIGQRYRYQVDRIFSNVDSAELMTLELTEVTIEDAEIYPAQFRERPEILP